MSNAEIHPPHPGVENSVTVLAVGSGQDYQPSLREVFRKTNWQLFLSEHLQAAEEWLARHRTAVVLCERQLADGTWTDLFHHLQSMEEAPLLIVTARDADDALWAEVLNLGGYDVLAMPFESTEVVRVISMAWLQWKRSPNRAAKDRLLCATA